MKPIFLTYFLLLVSLPGLTQTDTFQIENDTASAVTPPVVIRTPPVKKPVVIKPVTELTVKADTSLLMPDSGMATQTLDSTVNNDSVFLRNTQLKTDTLLYKKYQGIDSFYAHFLDNPFLHMKGKPVYQLVKMRWPHSKDKLFYLVAGLVFYLACIKILYSRYFINIFRFFFQPSFKQKQTREQLMQNNLPSLLLNLFFILSGGTYIALLVSHFGLLTFGFWKIILYSNIMLLVLYLGKYIIISFSGWVFNVKEAASTYIFIVYLINKIIGVLLLPFIFVLAFSKAAIIDVSVTISYLLITLLFLYRYGVSYFPVRRELRVSPLHFLIYIVSFEILPLLFIYKSLILYMDRTL